MMISPERDVLVMLDQQVLHDEQVGVFLGVGQDLDDRIYTLVVRVHGEALSAEQGPKGFTKRRLIEALPQLWIRILVVTKILEHLLVLLPRHKFQLAKLHRLKSARRV